MKTVCPYCRPWFGRIGDLVAEAGSRRRPAPEHGHRLWMVTTHSNVYLFYAPSKDDLPAVVKRAQRSRQEPRFKARLADTATLAKMAASGERVAYA